MARHESEGTYRRCKPGGVAKSAAGLIGEMVEALYGGAIAVLSGRTDAQVTAAYDALDLRYRETHRAYHNLRHIEMVLETALWITDGLDQASSARVDLALIYHDAVYDPRSKTNETDSAALARKDFVGLGLDDKDISDVERLILVTREHRANDPLGALVVDADLAILQETPDRYDHYARAIRKEYEWVSDADFRKGRTVVLERLLARKLFSSPLLDEDAARANLRREIDWLAIA